jgi:Na+-translocating ferredoxin:NAD+ oxidoreductase subunit A
MELSYLTKLMLIVVSAGLVNNMVLTRFLGICPFVGVSKKFDPALGMGIAVTLVMTIAAFISWLLFNYVLKPFNLQYLQTIFFILVIASLVQLLEMIINKFFPVLKAAFGIYLPLITTNCAVLGVAVLNVMQNYTLAEAMANGVGSGLGFILALLLMSGIRERLEAAPVPSFLKGAPIAFITAALLSMAFLGFNAMISI